jgi:hypothetical protein
MLVRGLLTFDANGRVRTTQALPEVFNGGTPTIAGLLSFVNGVPIIFRGGLGYFADKSMAGTFSGSVDHYVSGLAITSSRMLLMSTSAPIDHYIAGLPLAANGALCIAAPEVPPSLRAFSDGFSNGFG